MADEEMAAANDAAAAPAAAAEPAEEGAAPAAEAGPRKKFEIKKVRLAMRAAGGAVLALR